MSVARLRRVIPPPAHPQEVPDAAVWAEVTARLGPLPDDYYDFVREYGTGYMARFLTILNPAAANPYANLLRRFKAYTRIFQEINASGLEAPIRIFPEPFGVLPFGGTDNGDCLMWETAPNLRDWEVSVMPARESVRFRVLMTMTDFLAGVFDGTLVCPLFPDDVRDLPLSFEPGS